jgi:transcription elongation factor GreA
MNNHILITEKGLNELKAELSDLKDIKRPALVERLSIARSMGDLAENSDYISAKEELSFMDSRIDELEDLVKEAKVAVPVGFDKIGFGHTVTVMINSSTTSFQIVGEPEADPAKRKISHSSPLGLALMGKKVGDKVEVEAPVGKILYTIVSIE